MDNITSLVIVLSLFAHFIGDFILQSDAMALKKSKNVRVLLEHAGIYIIPFYPICLFFNIPITWLFVNMFCHFCVDFVSSKITAHFWKTDERHWFFVTIGADQFIHQLFIITTLILFTS